MGERFRVVTLIKLLAATLAASAGLVSCASELKKAEAELAEIEAWLPGTYNNMEQAEADAAQGRGSHVSLTLSIVPIYIPTFGDHVFYLQETDANNPGHITKQRLLSFEAMKDGGVLATVYTLAQPGRWRDGHLNPNLFKGMMYNDATPMAGCELLWKKDEKDSTKFVASNPTGGCRATIPSLGGSVRLQTKAELTAAELSLAELAYNSSGQLVQGDATEPFYRYRK